MESAHRTRLAELQAETRAARERLHCAEVFICSECERLFNAEKAIKKDKHVFCNPKCVAVWGKARTMPTLREFLEHRFLPDAETRHKAKPGTYRYYKQSSGMLGKSKLADVRLDELTEEHAQIYAMEHR